MSPLLFQIIIYAIGAIFVGMLVGLLGVMAMKMILKIRDRKDVLKVIEGRKANKYQMDDGKIIEVNNFRVPRENGKADMLITLKGGIIKEDVNKAQGKQENSEAKSRDAKQSSTHHSIFRR